MNYNILIIFFCAALLLVSFILLFYFHYTQIFQCFQTQSTVLFKKIIQKKVNKNNIAHFQNWKCASCNGIMLSQFKVTTDNYKHFAICINCSSNYKTISEECLV